MKRGAFQLLMLIVLWVQPAFSQRAAADTTDYAQLSLEELLNVEISGATRIGTVSANQAPATVITVSEEDIRRHGYRSLLDVMRMIPEIKIETLNDSRWHSDYSIRGVMGNDHFIILLDGVRISSPTNEQLPIIENFPVHMAKTVEILFGPASAVYGADAFTGVVNIITKKPSEAGKFVQTTLQGGTFDSRTANISMGEVVGKNVEIRLSGQLHHDATPPFWRFYGSDYANINGGLSTGTFQTRFGPQTPRNLVYSEPQQPVFASAFHGAVSWKNWTGTFFMNDVHVPSSLVNSPDNAVYNSDVFLGHRLSVGNITHKFNEGRLESISQITGSKYQIEPESNFRNVYSAMEPAYKYSEGWMLKVEQLISYEFSELVTLSGGLNHDRFISYPRGHDLERPFLGNGRPSGVIVNTRYPNNPAGIMAPMPRIVYQNTGGFVQAKTGFSSKITVTAGTRVDYDSRFGLTVNPRLGLVWTPAEKLTVKALAGSAFLAPSPQRAYEQFGGFYSLDNGTTYQSGFFHLPNPDLDPQTMRMFELTSRYRISDALSLYAGGFLSLIQGKFSLVPESSSSNRYNGSFMGWPVAVIEITDNQGEQQNYGFQLRADVSKPIGSGQFRWMNAVSWVDGKVEVLLNGTERTMDIGAVSPVSFNSVFDLDYRPFSVAVEAVVYGPQRTHPSAQPDAYETDGAGNFTGKRQTIDGYALVNATVRYRWADNLAFFSRGYNLLDQRFRTVNLGAAPEGGASGSAAVEFANGAPQWPFRLMAGMELSF